MPGFLVGVGKAGDVAERSPAVISANLKEDMLLQKKLVVLNRSEKSVVHQIKVDQKVVYKRFQARLTCSKLAYARLVGNRELQMQLRAKNLRGLNTDIAGNSDEDYVFLEKLEQRPCTATSFTPRLETPQTRHAAGLNLESKEKNTRSQLPRGGRSLSAKARKSEQFTDSGNMPSNIQTVVRPATTKGTRVMEELGLCENSLQKSQKKKTEIPKFETIAEDKTWSSVATSTQYSTSESDTAEHDENGKATAATDSEDKKTGILNVGFLEKLEIRDVRLNTVTELKTTTDSEPSSPKQYSRRASKAADFFQAEEKIDLVGLRLKEAKELDFTEKVLQFCDELKEMKGASNSPDVDYYSMRLEMSLDQAEAKSHVKVPGTPESEHKRSVGNIFVRSLTVPKLNLT